jgi:Protein of unknown function (DUF1573)
MPVKLVKRRWDAMLVVIMLAAFLGCQGLSKSSPTPSVGQLTAAKSSVNFGNVQAGKSATLDSTITNTGASNTQISQISVSGNGFSVSGLSTPVTLAPAQTASFSVTFTAQSTGTFNGNVSVASDASNPDLNVSLTGAGVTTTQSTLSASNSISVGAVVDGTSGTQSGILTAAGSNVVVSSVSLGGTNPSEFSISGLSFPVNVTTSQPVSFTVKFTPGATGAASATASFVSNASNSPALSTLTGTGTPAPVHTVELSWTASTTAGVTSYNIYRATFGSSSCGAYAELGSTSSSVTTYTDSLVTDGTTYCYATAAVDPSGESGYSNVVEASIPTP